MPLIHVLNASPSSTEKKRQLLAALTATYAEVMEIRPDTIRVVLQKYLEKTGRCPGYRWPIPVNLNQSEAGVPY